MTQESPLLCLWPKGRSDSGQRGKRILRGRQGSSRHSTGGKSSVSLRAAVCRGLGLRYLAIWHAATQGREIIETREWPHPSFRQLDYGAEKVLRFFNQGYRAKLCAPDPIKNLGWLSLGLGCRALAIKMIIVEDPEQRKLVESRWQHSVRPNHASSASVQPHSKRSA
jgi:hypothetical protein